MLSQTNQFQAAEARLQEAERGLQVISAEQTRDITGEILTLRANIASLSGDVVRAVSLGRQALALLSEAEVIPRAAALGNTIGAYQVSGDVTTTTEREVAAAVACIRASDNLITTVISMCLLAHLHVLQGQLRRAATTYAPVVQTVPHPEVLHTFFSNHFYYFGLGDLLRERNDLETAGMHLAQGMTLVNETLSVDPFMVLRLLLEGASNREIARRLVVSVNTVKRQVYNLCGKLGVQSRVQIIARARALNLL
jgi:ATP/maltotriose-dependent transcriptional regulator MalT